MLRTRKYALERGDRVASPFSFGTESGVIIDVLGYGDARVRWDSGVASSTPVSGLMPLAPFTTFEALRAAMEQDRPRATVVRGPRGGFLELRLEGMKRGGRFVVYSLASPSFKHIFEDFFRPLISRLELTLADAKPVAKLKPPAKSPHTLPTSSKAGLA